MIRTLYFFLFISLSSFGFTQTTTKTSTKKNSIKFSPTITFDWSKSLKLKNNTNNYNFISGLNLNYQRLDKLNNYHEVGFLVGFIPLNSKKTTSYNGTQFGVEYNYKLVFARFKNNTLQIYTAVGTQLMYRKLQSSNFQLPNITAKSFNHNIVVSPGFQFSKNNFFFDFSIPTSFGYGINTQKTFYPNLHINYTESDVKNDSQRFNSLNWNVGFKAGVGAKF